MAHAVYQQTDKSADDGAVDADELQVAADLALDLRHEPVVVPLIDPILNEFSDRCKSILAAYCLFIAMPNVSHSTSE